MTWYRSIAFLGTGGVLLLGGCGEQQRAVEVPVPEVRTQQLGVPAPGEQKTVRIELIQEDTTTRYILMGKEKTRDQVITTMGNLAKIKPEADVLVSAVQGVPQALRASLISDLQCMGFKGVRVADPKQEPTFERPAGAAPAGTGPAQP